MTLAGLVIVRAIVRTWAASKHAGPAYFPDEYLYTELSRSIATTGHAYVRGAPSHFAPLLAPLVTAPAWLLGNVSTGYHAVQAINATFASLAAVPVFVPRAHTSHRSSASACRSRARARVAGSALHVVHALGADRVSAGSCGGRHGVPRPRSTEHTKHRRVRRLCSTRELCSPSVRRAASMLPRRPRGMLAREQHQGHVATALAQRRGPRAPQRSRSQSQALLAAPATTPASCTSASTPETSSHRSA